MYHIIVWMYNTNKREVKRFHLSFKMSSFLRFFDVAYVFISFVFEKHQIDWPNINIDMAWNPYELGKKYAVFM